METNLAHTSRSQHTSNRCKKHTRTRPEGLPNTLGAPRYVARNETSFIVGSIQKNSKTEEPLNENLWWGENKGLATYLTFFAFLPPKSPARAKSESEKREGDGNWWDVCDYFVCLLYEYFYACCSLRLFLGRLLCRMVVILWVYFCAIFSQCMKAGKRKNSVIAWLDTPLGGLIITCRWKKGQLRICLRHPTLNSSIPLFALFPLIFDISFGNSGNEKKRSGIREKWFRSGFGKRWKIVREFGIFEIFIREFGN